MREGIAQKESRNPGKGTKINIEKIGVKALPLLSGDEIIGVLALASSRERIFEEQAAFLETLERELAEKRKG